MEDQDQNHNHTNSSETPPPDQRTEPVRSRWTPKPEQILILESIFNSGMVNPPKDETVRIRKLLEKFGAVGDANVFYWFQNRRSRSRRRQRQIQASLSAGEQQQQQPRGTGGGVISQYDQNSMGYGGNSLSLGSYNNNNNQMNNNSGSSCFVGGSGSSSSCGLGGNEGGGFDEYFSFSGHTAGTMQDGFHQSSVFGTSDDHGSSLHYQSGVITVFINGMATEVGRGPLDMKAMFGGDFVLFHSSGVPVQVNEFGFLVQSLQHGESYFLVPRHS